MTAGREKRQEVSVRQQLAAPRQTASRQTPARQHTAQRPPDGSLGAAFPARRLRRGSRWHRQHQRTDGAWWFASSGQGRFDLPRPLGTCYLASSAAGAIRERIGPDLLAHGKVPASVLTGRVVSALHLQQPARAADLDHVAAAAHLVARELPVMTPYDLPQAWARVLHRDGFDAVIAGLRCSPGDGTGLALFGEAGQQQWPADDTPRDAAQLASTLGIRLIDSPTAAQVTIERPGGTV